MACRAFVHISPECVTKRSIVWCSVATVSTTLLKDGRNATLARRPRQDRECHIVVDNEAWVGRFVVWSHPMIHPWDVQVWTAKPPPKWAKFVSYNTIICTRKGRGASGIRNADQDGDLFGFSNDRRLLDLFDALPEGSGDSAFRAAQARVKQSLSEVPFEALPSVDAYRAYVLMVDTLPVRGLVYAIAERVLNHVFHRSADPRQDGSLVAAIELGSYTHAAMDVPKKFLGTEVVRRARACLKAAGVKLRGKGSRKVSETLKGSLKFKHITRAEACTLLGKELDGRHMLGKVWLPCSEIRLSSAAGAAFRQMRLARKPRGHMVAMEVDRAPLPEVCGLVAHRVCKPGAFGRALRSGDAKPLLQDATALDAKSTGPAPISSVNTLKDRDLF